MLKVRCNKMGKSPKGKNKLETGQKRKHGCTLVPSTSRRKESKSRLPGFRGKHVPANSGTSSNTDNGSHLNYEAVIRKIVQETKRRKVLACSKKRSGQYGFLCIARRIIPKICT